LARLTKPGFFMLSQKQIKLINSLQQKKFRNEHEAFTAEGTRLVEELLGSRLKIQHLYASGSWIDKHLGEITTLKIPFTTVSEKELDRISTLKTPNQVVAVIKIPSMAEYPNQAENEFLLLLDGINDPGNLGTILRTADWFGIRNIVCSPGSADLFNPKTIQATMGSIARMRVSYLDLQEFLKNTAPALPVYGSLLSGRPIREVEKSKTGIVIIGSEAHGISQELMPYITHPVLIPASKGGRAGVDRPESLNAAIAAGILCYELMG
jgi:RNA methyltransferase, TrmH family